MSSACEHLAEMLLILILLLVHWLFDAKSQMWLSKEKSHDFVWA